jgi:hypothetical protein
MGHARQPEQGERAEPEDLRADRDLAQPADRRHHPFVFLEAGWGGEVRNASLLVATGVNDEGFREVPAVAEESKEAIHAQEDRATARQKAEQVAVKLKQM